MVWCKVFFYTEKKSVQKIYTGVIFGDFFQKKIKEVKIKCKYKNIQAGFEFFFALFSFD
jgi:hypothetical protein